MLLYKCVYIIYKFYYSYSILTANIIDEGETNNIKLVYFVIFSLV